MNRRTTKLRFLSRRLRAGSFLVPFQGFGLETSGGRGHYQRVVTRKEGRCHHAFIPPILEANTAHKPCCHRLGGSPKLLQAHSLEGGAEEPEMVKTKNNHQGSLQPSLRSSPFSLSLLETDVDWVLLKSLREAYNLLRKYNKQNGKDQSLKKDS